MNPCIKKGKILNCKTCGKEVYCRPSLMNRDRWCSKKCWWKFRKIDGLKQRTGKNITCVICGKEKYYNGFRINNLDPKFCSNICKYKDFILKNKPKGIYIKCGGCEKMIYAPPRKINRKVYCSNVCAGKKNILNLGNRMLGRKHNAETKIKMSKAFLGVKRKKTIRI